MNGLRLNDPDLGRDATLWGEEPTSRCQAFPRYELLGSKIVSPIHNYIYNNTGKLPKYQNIKIW